MKKIFLFVFVGWFCMGYSQNGQAGKILPSDYSSAGNWLNLPADVSRHEVDLIYFYPTTYIPGSQSDPVVCPIDHPGMRERARKVFSIQATAFETSCNIFAPYYRQGDALTITQMPFDKAEEMLSGEPLTDITAALDYYFEHYNHGRPFILASHSQGSMMARLVLCGYMKMHPEIYQRMIAAYVIGFSVDKKMLEENPHLKFARGADDYGVVVSYNTEGPGNATASNYVVTQGSVAINPINWRRDDTYAPAGKSLGSYVGKDGVWQQVKGLADARVDTVRGVVVCGSAPLQPYGPSAVAAGMFGPYSFHSNDYGFYYYDLRKNAQDRIAAYFRDQKGKR